MSDWPTEEDCAAFYNAITDPTKTFWLGVAKQRQESRAAAFGAIRRAAEYARYHERRAADWKRNGVQDLSDNCAFTADGIRRAIRAAIGSPKA